MNKHIMTTVAVGVVLGGAGFFGGMKYGQKIALTPKALASLSQQQRQQLFQEARTGTGSQGQQGMRTFGGRQGGQQGGGFVGGEITAKDDKSVTVKMNDGSSKIVFYSQSTTIGKTTEGSGSDLEVGKQVVINGTANSDGTVTAQNIQIRPAQNPQSQPTQ